MPCLPQLSKLPSKRKVPQHELQRHHYTIAYGEPGPPLVRSDIKAAENKAAAYRIRCAFADGRRERAAAQKALFLPSEDTEGGSHD